VATFIVFWSALDRAAASTRIFDFTAKDAELARRLAKSGRQIHLRFAGLFFWAAPRRRGLFRVLLRYSANYLWTHLFKRPFRRLAGLPHVAGATTAIGSASTIARPDLFKDQKFAGFAPRSERGDRTCECPGTASASCALTRIVAACRATGCCRPHNPLAGAGSRARIAADAGNLAIFAAVVIGRAHPSAPAAIRRGLARWVGNLSMGLVSNGILVLPP